MIKHAAGLVQKGHARQLPKKFAQTLNEFALIAA
jgi:hypothetical protein